MPNTFSIVLTCTVYDWIFCAESVSIFQGRSEEYSEVNERLGQLQSRVELQYYCQKDSGRGRFSLWLSFCPKQIWRKHHHLTAYTSGSQTGVRGPFGVRKTIFWGPWSNFQKINKTLLKKKNLCKIKFSGNLFFQTKLNKHNLELW